MNEFDRQLIGAFYNAANDIPTSEQFENRLKTTTPRTKHTACGKRILTLHVIIFIFIIVLIPTTGYAASKAVQVLTPNVPEGYFSTEEMEDLYQELINQGYTDEEIHQMDDLELNDNGLLFGPDNMGADLVLVTSDQGIDGYVYRDELYPEVQEVTTPEEAVKWTEEFTEKYPNGYVITVYEEDGKTAIGTFTIQ